MFFGLPGSAQDFLGGTVMFSPWSRGQSLAGLGPPSPFDALFLPRVLRPVVAVLAVAVVGGTLLIAPVAGVTGATKSTSTRTFLVQKR